MLPGVLIMLLGVLSMCKILTQIEAGFVKFILLFGLQHLTVTLLNRYNHLRRKVIKVRQ